MNRIALMPLAALLAAAPSFALGLAVSGGYFVGVPAGGPKITTAQVAGEEVPVDMAYGFPFKVGLANFGIGTLIAVTPLFDIDVGAEFHYGYKNKEGTIGYSYKFDGYTFFYSLPLYEGMVTWSEIGFYAGPRVNFLRAEKIRVFAAGGFLVTRNRFNFRGYGEGDYAERYSYTGITPGAYGGGGCIVSLTDTFALTFPVKFNYLFTGEYQYEGTGPSNLNHWQPGPYVTVGASAEFRLI